MRQKKLQKNFNQFFKKKLENKKIAVTGSNGFISKHLIQELKSLKIKKLKINEINSKNLVLLSAVISFILETFPFRSTGSFFSTNNATYIILIASIILSYKTLIKIKSS